MNRLEYKYEASPRRHFFYPADAAIWHYTAVQYARKKLHRRHWYVHRRSVASTVAVTVKCRVAAARMSRSTKNLAKLRGTTFCQRMNTRRQVHSTRRCCSVDAATGGGSTRWTRYSSVLWTSRRSCWASGRSWHRCGHRVRQLRHSAHMWANHECTVSCCVLGGSVIGRPDPSDSRQHSVHGITWRWWH